MKTNMKKLAAWMLALLLVLYMVPVSAESYVSNEVQTDAELVAALEIINNCAHPDYRPILLDYYNRATEKCHHAHTPHILEEALSFHEKFLETGCMK